MELGITRIEIFEIDELLERRQRRGERKRGKRSGQGTGKISQD